MDLGKRGRQNMMVYDQMVYDGVMWLYREGWSDGEDGTDGV